MNASAVEEDVSLHNARLAACQQELLQLQKEVTAVQKAADLVRTAALCSCKGITVACMCYGTTLVWVLHNVCVCVLFAHCLIFVYVVYSTLFHLMSVD